MVPSLNLVNLPSCIISRLLELLLVRFFFSLFTVDLSSELDELGDGLLVLILVLLEVPEVGLQGLVDLNLNKLFQALVLSGFQLYVGLLRDQKLVAGQLLLVELELLLECRKLVYLAALGVLKFADNLCGLVLLLGDSELEILALSLKQLGQLCLFMLQLIDLLFHFLEFSVEFRLLSSHFANESPVELTYISIASPVSDRLPRRVQFSCSHSPEDRILRKEVVHGAGIFVGLRDRISAIQLLDFVLSE